MWTEEVTVRAPVSFVGERVRQALRHLSTAIFYYVKSEVEKEQEVQGMFVNERLLISANQPASMKAMKGLSKAELTKILLTSKYTNDPRGVRSTEKLAALVNGTRLEDIEFEDDAEREEVATVALVIGNVVENPTSYLIHCRVDRAHQYIDGDDHQFKLIIVEGLRPVHAEQNLILAYCNSGSSAVAYVYGKKRPCTGCYLTFLYATQVMGRTNLIFNVRPGGFWQPAVDGLWALMESNGSRDPQLIDEFARLNLPETTYRSFRSGAAEEDVVKMRTDTKNEETGYDTESDDEEMG